MTLSITSRNTGTFKKSHPVLIYVLGRIISSFPNSDYSISSAVVRSKRNYWCLSQAKAKIGGLRYSQIGAPEKQYVDSRNG